MEVGGKNAHFSGIILGLECLYVGRAFTGTALNKHPCIEEVGKKRAHFFTVARLIVASRLPQFLETNPDPKPFVKHTENV